LRSQWRGQAGLAFFPATGKATCAALPHGFVTNIGPKGSPAGHVFAARFTYSHNMRGAFVVQLGPESDPAEKRFEGWVEEVDSGMELRFRSREELLKFLGARFDLVLASANKDRAGNKSEQVPYRKKISPTRKSKQS